MFPHPGRMFIHLFPDRMFLDPHQPAVFHNHFAVDDHSMSLVRNPTEDEGCHRIIERSCQIKAIQIEEGQHEEQPAKKEKGKAEKGKKKP